MGEKICRLAYYLALRTLKYSSFHWPTFRGSGQLKKTLAGGTPVVIEFQAPESFTLAKKVWVRASNETLDIAPYGLALCVIAYVDNQSGGAFFR